MTVAQYRRCVHAGACELDPLVDGDVRYLADAWPQVNIKRDEAARAGGRAAKEPAEEAAARARHRVQPTYHPLRRGATRRSPTPDA